MRVRLGFAVAAHLDPEILLIDEVLAVGDAEFQKKCLGKMGRVAREGRTVLFVSHNMAAIEQLCERCLLISQGNVKLDTTPQAAIAHYLSDWHEIRGPLWDLGNPDETNADIRITSVTCEPTSPFIGSELSILIDYSVGSARQGLKFGVSIETPLGQRITGSYTGREGLATGVVRGQNRAKVTFSHMNLIPGRYFCTVTIHSEDGENIIRIERAASFEVIGRDLTDSGYLVDQRNGLVWFEHEWDF
jgi:lipopolysaccharide transport system ATP-binding protein